METVVNKLFRTTRCYLGVVLFQSPMSYVNVITFFPLLFFVLFPIYVFVVGACFQSSLLLVSRVLSLYSCLIPVVLCNIASRQCWSLYLSVHSLPCIFHTHIDASSSVFRSFICTNHISRDSQIFSPIFSLTFSTPTLALISSAII